MCEYEEHALSDSTSKMCIEEVTVVYDKDWGK